MVAEVESDVFSVAWKDGRRAGVSDDVDGAAVFDGCIGASEGIEGLAVNFEVILVLYEPAMFFVANLLNMTVCAVRNGLDELRIVNVVFAAFQDAVVEVDV